MAGHGNEVVVPEMKLKYRDVFSLRNLYLMLHQTLLEEGWKGYDGEQDHSDIETLYSENIYQRGIHRGGKELWFWWRAVKYPEGKYSGFYRNKLDIDAHVVYAQNVEIIHQGKKMNAQNCEIEMSFRGKIELDYRDLWGHHWFLKHFKALYLKRIAHPEIEKREKELYRDITRIHSKVKQFLQLRTFVPVPEPFFAKQFGYDD